MSLPPLHSEGTRFVDPHGRQVILRGVNLGGDCKLPYPNGGTHVPSDFADHREVSFVGRPFPLDQADTHFARLAHWGFNCLRLLTTWEAVEHAGPGLFDTTYLDYLTEICRRAGEHGFYLFVDFHQDVFSRMTGGSGAPGWVLEAVGFDISGLSAADAALVMQQVYDYNDPRARQPERYPLMSWSRNYNYPANGVLWTLFFAGRDFAPSFEIGGVNIQDYLQGHFLACQRAVAERIAHLPHVLGFDTLNEPSMGFIGLGMHERRGIDRGGEMALPGLSWSPLNALYALAGHSVELGVNEISYLKGGCVEKQRQLANPNALRVWTFDGPDCFARDGAWTTDSEGQAVALDPNYFKRRGGREVEFEADYLVPFAHRVAKNMRQVRADWMLFFEKDGNTTFRDPSFPTGLPNNCVYAPHWYDLFTLMLKRFSPLLSYDGIRARPVFGAAGIRRMYVEQLGRMRDSAAWNEQQVPTLLGEFGIPFDLHGAAAYAAWSKGERGNKPWQPQIRALELTYDALDELLLSSTQWNYTASNRNDARIGDGWNQEDLSIFSEDQRATPDHVDSGGRALPGFVRPFVRRCQGRLTRVAYDRAKRDLQVEFEATPSINAATEVYVPRLIFGERIEVSCAGGEWQWDAAAQMLSLRVSAEATVHLRVRADSSE